MLPADSPVPMVEMESIGGQPIFRNHAGQEVRTDPIGIGMMGFSFESLDQADNASYRRRLCRRRCVTDEQPEVARRWLAERKRSLPTLIDADRALFRHYAIDSIPVLMIIRPSAWFRARSSACAVSGTCGPTSPKPCNRLFNNVCCACRRRSESSFPSPLVF